MLSLLSVVFCLAAAANAEANFDKHVVVRVIPQNPRQLLFLQQLRANDVELDFWKEPGHVGHNVDIHLSPEQIKHYTPSMKMVGLEPETIISDVGTLIRQEKRNGNTHRWSDWTEWEELAAIEEWLVEVAATYSDFVTLTDIGDSWEGRDLWVLRINKNPSEDKRVVWLDSNIHAREWVTSAACTWIINELLTNPDYDDYLNNWDFHILPVLNPDGFAYSHTDNRLWRKTRSNFGSNCFGTDPNRNWGYAWGGPGTSSDPCSDIYHGPDAFSEPENLAASEYIDANRDSIDMYLSFHSYSQLILIPFGDTFEHPPDYDDLYAVGIQSEQAIEDAGLGDGIWETGTIPDLLYLASGGSGDWAKGTAGIKYSFTYELRDRGTYGFVLPADQIVPASQETFAGFLAILDARDSAPEE